MKKISIEYETPEWVKWTTVDPGGAIYGYELEPHDNRLEWDVNKGKTMYLGSVSCYSGKWEKSKVEHK